MNTEIEKLVYLNTAGCGLISDASRAAGDELYKAFAINSSERAEYWRDYEAARIRKTIADFIVAPVDNVAMIPNFSFGINCLVQSLKGNEKVLLYRRDYPSLTQPFCINHFAISWIEAAEDEFTISLDTIEATILSEKINILAISHVQWLSGFKISLEKLGALCRKHQVWLIIDGTQSLGACELSLSGLPIDVFIASNYKWMNAGFGTGILFMSNSFMQQYTPVIGGHNSYQLLEGSWAYHASIKSYEPGGVDMFGLTVLEKAIEEKNKKGLPWIASHNKALTKILLAGLQQLPVQIVGDAAVENRASIVFIKDEEGLGDWLKQHQIIVTQRDGTLRISMHFHNTEADVQALLHCIAAKS